MVKFNNIIFSFRYVESDFITFTVAYLKKKWKNITRTKLFDLFIGTGVGADLRGGTNPAFSSTGSENEMSRAAEATQLDV